MTGSTHHYPPLPDDMKEEDLPDEQRLVRRVFQHYDSSVRPVYNASRNVVVYIGMTLIQIMDMDEKNQVLVTNVWLVHTWKDQRIGWNPADFNGLWNVRIPANKLWLPDIVLYNNADDYTTGYMPTNAMVQKDGTIFWSPPVRLRSSCKVDITYFPFDLQCCHMKFGSWTYDKSQVDLVNSSSFIEMDSYITNGEWRYVDSTIIRNEVVYPIGHEIYPDVTVHVRINRRILYYVINIILPCMWLNVLSLLAFCLPPDEGEKVTLGVTVLLSYSVFMLLVAENMPSTSEFVPLIGIYLTVSMAVTSVSVILTVLVLKCYHCGPTTSELPDWLRRLVLHWIARIVGCHPASFRTVRRSSSRKRRVSSKRSTMLDGGTADALRYLSPNDTQDITDRLVSEQCVNAIRYTDQYRSPRNSTKSLKDIKETYMDGFTSAAENGGDVDPSKITPLDEILKYLRIMVRKREEDDKENDMINEWRQVAIVMDKLFFWIFLLVMVIYLLTLLVFIPMTKPL
ncbi:neuronal acetylcholine receptor subunit alpha-10-like [Tubulanus polymorphus]|uniref:neuronal acetylcholine receptor subunit alpha-10-like n=1 Tax=Tubulanus polymorphus TaxID=672921 RepID=UPI003DA63D35